MAAYLPIAVQGVYAQGGPKTVGDGGVTLDGLLDRSPADVRGRKT